MPLDEVLFEAEAAMEKAVDYLKTEFRGVRTGRASTGLVDSLRIEVPSYGSTLTLKELANLGVGEGNVIMIKPFDPTTLKDIEKGIEKSGLGINPQSDGKIIRLPVPPLSTERRNQLVTRIKQLAEQQRVAIRNVRRDANKALETEKKAKTLSEDDAKRGEEQIQKITDEYVRQLDKLLEEKTKEIMEV